MITMNATAKVRKINDIDKSVLRLEPQDRFVYVECGMWNVGEDLGRAETLRSLRTL